MKDGLRFVDCDMHIMEPPDLFDRYLDPKFKDRVLLPLGADGKFKRGTIVVDGMPTTRDAELQQYRKRPKTSSNDSSQPLSGSPRRMEMSPAIRIIQPAHGIRNSASFATHFISCGSLASMRMSRIDWWFATTTKGPPSGQRPCTSMVTGVSFG